MRLNSFYYYARPRIAKVLSRFLSQSRDCGVIKIKMARNLNMNGIHTDAFCNDDYEKAISALNSLQSNAVVLEAAKKKKNKNINVLETEKYLKRIGLTLHELDKIPIIHVAGTKGKGSTCAFVERILREYGFKTGLYSSPHLVAARERIRINGEPISKRDFSKYFWQVWNCLNEQKVDLKDMPAYFKFLTILSLQIFQCEKVDAVVFEVGIGGEYDCTNVIRSPIVCGITTLELDHTSLLGNTLSQIAWHKSGIMKTGVPTFTVHQHSLEALNMLVNRSKEKQSCLVICPPLQHYDWGGHRIELGLSGYVQFTNASLALQLAHYFIEATSKSRRLTNGNGATQEQMIDGQEGEPFLLSEKDTIALKNVLWPGRSQVLRRGRCTFFLDGAHTGSSVLSCVQWFHKASAIHIPPATAKTSVYRIVVFNLTGDRDESVMVAALCDGGVPFDAAVFAPNCVHTDVNAASDNTNFNVSSEKQLSRLVSLRRTWCKVERASLEARNLNGTTDETNACETIGSSVMSPLGRLLVTLPCIADAIAWIDPSLDVSESDANRLPERPLHLREADDIQILITGSLHLVGGFLSVLDPNLSQSMSETPCEMCARADWTN